MEGMAMTENQRAAAHIDFLIDEDVREKLGITGRELDTQALRLCGGFNDLREALKKEESVNRHLAVCFHNLLARHGTDKSKKLFRDELGYGKDDYSIDETCGFGLKTLAEAGNKNAQTGKSKYFKHPAL